MKKIIIAIEIVSLLAACVKKELWETSESEYYRMKDLCMAYYDAYLYDPHTYVDKKCIKFAKYSEEREGKLPFPKEFLQVLQKGQR
ncbi:MAG: hypothetical protein WDW19_03475 [Neisseriaceae bacterium]